LSLQVTGLFFVLSYENFSLLLAFTTLVFSAPTKDECSLMSNLPLELSSYVFNIALLDVETIDGFVNQTEIFAQCGRFYPSFIKMNDQVLDELKAKLLNKTLDLEILRKVLEFGNFPAITFLKSFFEEPENAEQLDFVIQAGEIAKEALNLKIVGRSVLFDSKHKLLHFARLVLNEEGNMNADSLYQALDNRLKILDGNSSCVLSFSSLVASYIPKIEYDEIPERARSELLDFFANSFQNLDHRRLVSSRIVTVLILSFWNYTMEEVLSDAPANFNVNGLNFTYTHPLLMILKKEDVVSILSKDDNLSVLLNSGLFTAYTSITYNSPHLSVQDYPSIALEMPGAAVKLDSSFFYHTYGYVLYLLDRLNSKNVDPVTIETFRTEYNNPRSVYRNKIKEWFERNYILLEEPSI
jgi:hypothetical protein